MRLRTKLVLLATCLTFTIVLVLSLLFLSELLRQRVTQTAANNDILARQLLMMTRQAIEVELMAKPPAEHTDEAFHAAVADALRSHQPLIDTMNAFVRYSPAVQDVSVTDAQGLTLMSTDPTTWDQQAAVRMNFDRLRDAGVLDQVRQVFGRARVLDVPMALDRNGQPFLTVHIGVRSTFLKNNYVPWLEDALVLIVIGGVITMMAAGVLSSLALRPIEDISRRLELLAGQESDLKRMPPGRPDAMVRVTRSIERLGVQMQETEAGYTDLQANLTQMLDTLRDGVLLFTSEDRAAMASDAVANFVETDGRSLVGRELTEIFRPETALGNAVLRAFELQMNVTAANVRMEDGRMVEISLDHIEHGPGQKGRMGTLLTLHDVGSAQKLEKELEVSRRLAAVGRLTAGVGHEVKNPINAMVVHLELLKGKLSAGSTIGAERHVEILAGEMQRLDRVVQTLADFTRPMELHLSELDLGDVARSVMGLTGGELAINKIAWECNVEPVTVRADDELLRQALLNLVLNAMQAMLHGGLLKLTVWREGEVAVVSISDEGSGIPPELMPRIFELYFTTKPKGSGIGLAMTYRIVQMHGGAMEVQSDVGQGTTFTVKLPAVYSASVEGRRGRARVAAGRDA